MLTHNLACHPRLNTRYSACEGKGTQVVSLSRSKRNDAGVHSSTLQMLWDLGPLPLAILADRSAGDDNFVLGA
jgi:hypothetical protein